MRERMAGFWRRPTAPYVVVTLLAALVYVSISVAHFLNAGWDDMYMTLWAGESLAAGRGFVNYNYDRLEISSSLLHAVLIALFALVDESHVYSLNKMFGLLMGVGVFVMLFLFRRSAITLQRHRFLAYCWVLLLLVASPTFLYWNLGGQETPYAIFLLTLFGLALTTYWTQSSAGSFAAAVMASGLYVLTRPEGFFVVLFAAVFVGFRWGYGRLRRRDWAVVGVPLFVFVSVTTFRLIHFGMAFPNPVYAKSESLLDSTPRGIGYVMSYFEQSYFAFFQLLILAAMGVGFIRLLARGRKGLKEDGDYFATIFPYGLVIAGLMVVMTSGGDWMPFYRFIAPFVPLLSIVTVLGVFQGVAVIQSRINDRELRTWLPGFAALLLLVLLVSHPVRRGPDIVPLLPRSMEIRPAPEVLMDYQVGPVLASWHGLDERLQDINQDHVRHERLLENFIREGLPLIYKHRRQEPLMIATSQMGFFPYFIREHYPDMNLHFTDLCGLCSKDVSHLDVDKHWNGLTVCVDLEKIFTGNAGPVSDLVLGQHPELVYATEMTKADKAVLRGQGYTMIIEDRLSNVAYRMPDELDGIEELVAPDEPTTMKHRYDFGTIADEEPPE